MKVFSQPDMKRDHVFLFVFGRLASSRRSRWKSVNREYVTMLKGLESLMLLPMDRNVNRHLRAPFTGKCDSDDGSIHNSD